MINYGGGAPARPDTYSKSFPGYADLAVPVTPAAPAVIFLPVLFAYKHIVIITNSSPGDQTVRIGDSDVAYGAGIFGVAELPAAMSALNVPNPLGRIILPDWTAIIYAVGSAAGATVQVLVWRFNPDGPFAP